MKTDLALFSSLVSLHLSGLVFEQRSSLVTHLRCRVLGFTVSMLLAASTSLTQPCWVDVECYVYPNYTICVEMIVCT